MTAARKPANPLAAKRHKARHYAMQALYQWHMAGADLGEIEAEFVVNCSGMWARQLGALNGVAIPNQSTEHYYLITEPFDGMTRDLPIIEDPSCHGYYREETGGLMIGLFEPVCAPWMVDGVPAQLIAAAQAEPGSAAPTAAAPAGAVAAAAAIRASPFELGCPPAAFQVVGIAPRARCCSCSLLTIATPTAINFPRTELSSFIHVLSALTSEP